MERIGQERDEAEEAEQAGERPLDGALAPLALRLDAEVATHLLEGDLNHPSTLPPKQQS